MGISLKDVKKGKLTKADIITGGLKPTRQLFTSKDIDKNKMYEVEIDTGTGKISKVVSGKRAEELANYYSSYGYAVEVNEY
jgi:hypothetical protein